jgi:hypothetical protein
VVVEIEEAEEEGKTNAEVALLPQLLISSNQQLLTMIIISPPLLIQTLMIM